MNTSIEVVLGPRQFLVSLDGDIQADWHAASCIELDEVRLAAADIFLLDRRLDKTQHRFWAAVARKTERRD